MGSFGLHYTVQTDASDPLNGDLLAESFDLHARTEIEDCVSDKTQIAKVTARRVDPTAAYTGVYYLPDVVGDDAIGEPMAQSNAAMLLLHQPAGSPRNNGKIYIPGISENQVEGNTWKTGFTSGVLLTLANKLETQVVEVSAGPGRWDPAILSKSFSPPATPHGTALDVTKITVSGRVSRQSRRRPRTSYIPD